MISYDENFTKLSGTEGQIYAKQYFEQISVDSINWKILWRDKKNASFWLEYFPEAEMHGGGPSEFVKITDQEAKLHFRL